MKPFIHRLFFLLIVAGTFPGCGNEDEQTPEPDYYTSFKVDGKELTYENAGLYPAVFSKDDNAQFYFATINVLKTLGDGTSNFINIIVRNETPFEEGMTFQMQNGILYQNTNLLARINFTWADEHGDIYNAVLLEESHPTLEVKDNATVSFTKIENDVIEGTYSAVILGPVSPTSLTRNVQKTVTEGKFRLKLVNSIQ